MHLRAHSYILGRFEKFKKFTSWVGKRRRFYMVKLPEEFTYNIHEYLM